MQKEADLGQVQGEASTQAVNHDHHNTLEGSCMSHLSTDRLQGLVGRADYSSQHRCPSSHASRTTSTIMMGTPLSSMAVRVTRGIMAGAGGALGGGTQPPGAGEEAFEQSSRLLLFR